MTDDFASQGEDTGASATAPAAPTQSIEEVRAQIEAQYEERIKGFQRLVASRDERLSAFEKELQQLKTANLTPEEQEELREREKDARIAELEAKLELQNLGRDYPDEMPHFQRLLDAETAEDQLKVFREFRQALSQSNQPAAPSTDPLADDLDVPEVDPNNPRRTATGMEMNEEIADKVLASFAGRNLHSIMKRR